jgi:ABC-type multidrug transport system fused ATPase/permease subunit
MIRKLLGFDLYDGRERGLASGLVLGLASAFFEALPFAILVKALALIFAGPVATSSILIIAAALVAAFLGAWLCKAGALLASFTATYRTVAGMRLTAADRLGRMSLGILQRGRGATLTDLFTDRFSLYQDIVTHMWWQVSSALGLPLFLWLLLMLVDWRIGLLIAAMAPVSIALVPWSFRLLDRATDKVIPIRNDVANRVVEIAEGIKDIHLLDPAGGRLAAARNSIHRLERQSLATELAPAPAILAFGIVWSLALAASLVLAAMLWLNGMIAAFALAASLVLTVRLCLSLNELGIFLVEYRFARRALASIRDFVEQPLLPAAITPRQAMDATVDIDQVCFAHAEEATLRDISITIPSGRMLALVGVSGAGKSTLAGLIARLWDVDSGAIRIGGVDIRQMTPDTLNRAVSMVLQEVSLFELSVRDNVRLGRPDASDTEVEAATRAAQIHERIMTLPEGYDTVLEGGGYRLSGGERQRLAIARAILKDAPVLILDEASASIDLENEWLIQKALENLTRGKTVIVIAHRLWTVTEADRIACLDQGRLAELGTHAELLAKGGLYARLWAAQHR